MRVLRGRESTLSEDRDATQVFLEQTRETAEPGVRVWSPPRHVAFGRRDANREGYEQARQHATRQGYEVVERSVGGHAVAFTGTTVAFALAEPVVDSRSGIHERYDRLSALVTTALSELGVDAEQGEPEGAFCPGTHSLSANGKIVGLAQRVHSDVAVTSGVVVVRDHGEIADVLEPIYDALGIAFDPDAVGSIARAGGVATPAVVVETLVDHLAGEDADVLRET